MNSGTISDADVRTIPGGRKQILFRFSRSREIVEPILDKNEKILNRFQNGSKTQVFANQFSTVHIGYSAIGYSAKSDIVPILGWSRFPYSQNYRI